MDTGNVNPGQTVRPLNYGEQAVGLTFNPGGNMDVQKAKELCAQLINMANDLYCKEDASPEKKNLLVEAVRQLQTAQMWIVKGITYPY